MAFTRRGGSQRNTLMTVDNVDGLSYITNSRVLTVGLTVLVVLGATVDVEMGRLVDESSGLESAPALGAPQKAPQR